MRQQMLDVLLATSEVVIDAENILPCVDQALTEVRTDESSTARDENFFCHFALLVLGIECTSRRLAVETGFRLAASRYSSQIVALASLLCAHQPDVPATLFRNRKLAFQTQLRKRTAQKPR